MVVCWQLKRYLGRHVFWTVAVSMVLLVSLMSYYQSNLLLTKREYSNRNIQKYLEEFGQRSNGYHVEEMEVNTLQPKPFFLSEHQERLLRQTERIPRQDNKGKKGNETIQPHSKGSNETQQHDTKRDLSFNLQPDNHKGKEKTQPLREVHNIKLQSVLKKDLTLTPHVDTNRNITYTKYIGVGKYRKENIQFLVDRRQFEPESLTVPKSDKVILWYIPTRYHPKLAGLHPLRSCPEKRCRVTTNRFFYNQSDALVFTAQILKGTPPEKLPNQIWILHNHESPHWASGNKFPLYQESWKSKFNWTLDYRDDADIESPYGLFSKKDGVFVQRDQVKKDYKAILGRKNTRSNATVAWMVSNCQTQSRRFEYVREMKKYIKVDIFGGCGQKCARSSDADCLSFISKRYKFYLSFENNFCKDYITEKFFRYYNSDLILVVRGGGNYSRIAPNGTYINAGDFASPKRLADYLINLLKDDNRYMDMLKQKDKYEPKMEAWPIVDNGKIRYMTYHYDAEPMCQVCDRLWNQDKYRKHYDDMGAWFSKGICTASGDTHKLRKRNDTLI